MNKADLLSNTESQINQAALSIADGKKDMANDNAVGKLLFLCALHRVLDGKPHPGDLGMMDGINDCLQQLGLVDTSKTFFAAIQP
ncbi:MULTISPECIES: hypothetical protein [Pseudomonas]|uniref:Uncharacterized protein n=1 Tax=Pseudomonas gingeri TaxID=117681 RepID=A0A7Y8BSP6_9PSED|nr:MULTISPECIES: hypothetical protein [Pseudomonas]MPQ70644.1 hypothetical protein [Pseudomonas sp. MWU12-2323]NWB86479.1 hypothetical protein [Pseudomonas gingeri]